MRCEEAMLMTEEARGVISVCDATSEAEHHPVRLPSSIRSTALQYMQDYTWSASV